MYDLGWRLTRPTIPKCQFQFLRLNSTNRNFKAGFVVLLEPLSGLQRHTIYFIYLTVKPFTSIVKVYGHTPNHCANLNLDPIKAQASQPGRQDIVAYSHFHVIFCSHYLFMTWLSYQQAEGALLELQMRRLPSIWLQFMTAFQHL